MAIIGVWGTCAAAYLLLAGQVSLDECVAALGLGAAGVLFWLRLRRVSEHRFSFDRSAGFAVIRAIAGLPPKTLRVGLALLASFAGLSSGRRLELPLHGGDRDDPAEAGRRAITVLAASLAPDSFVLRADRRRGAMTFHALTDQDLRDDPRWPV